MFQVSQETLSGGEGLRVRGDFIYYFCLNSM